jgi:hypothetical protein
MDILDIVGERLLFFFESLDAFDEGPQLASGGGEESVTSSAMTISMEIAPRLNKAAAIGKTAASMPDPVGGVKEKTVLLAAGKPGRR